MHTSPTDVELFINQPVSLWGLGVPVAHRSLTPRTKISGDDQTCSRNALKNCRFGSAWVLEVKLELFRYMKRDYRVFNLKHGRQQLLHAESLYKRNFKWLKARKVYKEIKASAPFWTRDLTSEIPAFVSAWSGHVLEFCGKSSVLRPLPGTFWTGAQLLAQINV